MQTIHLASALPTSATPPAAPEIDGYTQPGASPNTDPIASNAVLRIAITGGGDDVEYHGVPHHLPEQHDPRAVDLQRLAQGLDGRPERPQQPRRGQLHRHRPGGHLRLVELRRPADGGILIDGGAHDNRIGEETLAGRNVISGNQRSGVHIYAENTRANIVRNNIVGLSPDGTRRVRNRTHGVDVDQGATLNIIGGTGTLQRNVISGNGVDGVEVVHHTDDRRQPGRRQLHRHRT